MRGALARVPAQCPDCVGGGPGQNLLTSKLTRKMPSNGCVNPAHHLAATAVLTSTVVPLIVPVTVAFLPACWSSSVSNALSAVFRT